LGTRRVLILPLLESVSLPFSITNRLKRDTLCIEEATVSYMWDNPAISENSRYSTSRLGCPKRLAAKVRCGREGYVFRFRKCRIPKPAKAAPSSRSELGSGTDVA